MAGRRLPAPRLRLSPGRELLGARLLRCFALLIWGAWGGRGCGTVVLALARVAGDAGRSRAAWRGLIDWFALFSPAASGPAPEAEKIFENGRVSNDF